MPLHHHSKDQKGWDKLGVGVKRIQKYCSGLRGEEGGGGGREGGGRGKEGGGEGGGRGEEGGERIM